MNRFTAVPLLLFALLGAAPAALAGPIANEREIAMLQNAARGDDPGAQLLLGLAYL